MKTGALTTFLALCLPVTVFATTLRLSNEVDLLVLDGKKCPVRYYAAQIASNWRMGHTNLSFGWRKPSVCPDMKSGFIFLHRW